MPSPFDQSRYQVRLEWGVDGLARLAPADVVVVVDVLRFSTTVTDAVAQGEVVSLEDARAISVNGARLIAAAGALASSQRVLVGCLRNAEAVAKAIVAEQVRRGQRTSVAVIAAGESTSSGGRAPMGEPAALSEDPTSGGRASAKERSSPSEGSLRFAVEDYLGAGAIVDALAALGIDHLSPEAAAASEAFRSLRGALRHLVAASGSGQELISGGVHDAIVTAAETNATSVVPVLRDGRLLAL